MGSENTDRNRPKPTETEPENKSLPRSNQASTQPHTMGGRVETLEYLLFFPSFQNKKRYLTSCVLAWTPLSYFFKSHSLRGNAIYLVTKSSPVKPTPQYNTDGKLHGPQYL